MSGDLSLPFQKAVYDALQADVTLSGYVGDRIYDHVPAGTAFPYVEIGDATGRPWDTDGDDGLEATLTLHVWSRKRGGLEAKRIQKAIYDVLHDADLTITGGTCVQIRLEFQETFNDADGLTRHGVQRFGALLDTA